MKKIKKFLWRFFPLVVCCCIIFSFATYAHAAAYTTINYKDYIDTVQSTMNGELVYCQFGYKDNFCQAVNANTSNNWWLGVNKFDINTNMFTPTTQDGESVYIVRIAFKPFGNNLLDISDIALDGKISVSYSWKFSRFFNYYKEAQFDINFYDKDQNYLYASGSVDYKSTSGNTVTYNYSFSPSELTAFKSNNAPKYIQIIFRQRFVIPADVFTGVFTAYPGESFSLILERSNSSVILDQNQELIDQNNDLINGTPQQNQQIQNDVNKLEGSSDKLNDLTGDLVVPKPSIDAGDVSVENLVDPSDVALVNQPLTSLLENETILQMIIIICTLILVSFVFFGKKG